jgi:hypothetical protein
VPWSFTEEGAAEKYMPQLQHNTWLVAAASLGPVDANLDAAASTDRVESTSDQQSNHNAETTATIRTEAANVQLFLTR